MPTQEVRLDGKALQNGRKLKYYGINSASRLTFHLREDSAGKARKAYLDEKWGRVRMPGRDATQIFCKTLTGYVSAIGSVAYFIQKKPLFQRLSSSQTNWNAGFGAGKL